MMQAGPSTPVENPLLIRIEAIMNFIYGFHRDFQKRKPSFQYTQEEFPIPDAFKNFIKNSVIQLEDTHLIQEFLSVLFKPNPIDSLIDAFQESFMKIDFMECVVMCCLASGVLNESGFIEAPYTAVEFTRQICRVHRKSGALVNFGVMV